MCTEEESYAPSMIVYNTRSYVLKLRQMLLQPMKIKTLERCELLITLKPRAAGRIYFSHEKIFCDDAKINCQNDRWIYKDPDDVPVIGIIKFPSRLYLLEVISDEGDVMSHFFGKGQTVTKEVYLDVIKNVGKPWIVQVTAGKPWLFQQDGAPAHPGLVKRI